MLEIPLITSPIFLTPVAPHEFSTHFFHISCSAAVTYPLIQVMSSFSLLFSLVFRNVLISLRCFHRPSRVSSDLQIGIRGRLRVPVLRSEHSHFENVRPALSRKPKVRAQYGKLVLLVVLVFQSEDR